MSFMELRKYRFLAVFAAFVAAAILTSESFLILLAGMFLGLGLREMFRDE